MSEYAFALDDMHYVFRLRTGKGEAKSVRFYYADRAVMTPELHFFILSMEKIREDRYFDSVSYTHLRAHETSLDLV